jgi:hypothetical protein
MYCSQNPLLFLPELPSTLSGLVCELPHNNQPYQSNEMTPDIVQQLNLENEEWMAQSKERCVTRCAIYKEEIMMKAWHPTRMKMLYEDLGYDVEDM